MKLRATLLSAAVIFGLTCSSDGSAEPASGDASGHRSVTSAVPNPAPADWKEWARWAEKLHPVTDGQGHGPDIGGDEWANALTKRLGIGDAAGQGPKVGSIEWRKVVERRLVPVAGDGQNQDERTLLSSHDTEAVFVGIVDHRCMGRTSLCPDRCGDSGKLATFRIVRYLDYKKPGEYGDPRQECFQVLVEDNLKKPKVPATIRDAILALKAGDSVHLKWNHDYVSRAGSKFPERPIMALAPIANTPAN